MVNIVCSRPCNDGALLSGILNSLKGFFCFHWSIGVQPLLLLGAQSYQKHEHSASTRTKSCFWGGSFFSPTCINEFYQGPFFFWCPLLTYPEVDVLHAILTSSRLRKMRSFLTFQCMWAWNLLHEGSEAGEVTQRQKRLKEQKASHSTAGSWSGLQGLCWGSVLKDSWDMKSSSKIKD